MNKWLKIFIWLIIIGIIGAGLGYKFIYNKPHKDYEKASVDFTLSGFELFSEYKNSNQSANQKYNGKVIEISGIVNSIDRPESMTIAVFTLEEGVFGDEGIRCTMLPNYAENLSSYLGKKIKIKGYCTGYNETDVIFEKCSIVE